MIYCRRPRTSIGRHLLEVTEKEVGDLEDEEEGGGLEVPSEDSGDGESHQDANWSMDEGARCNNKPSGLTKGKI